jgi:hypothetical protein
VRDFLADMNTLLSGGTSIVPIADLGTVVSDVNNSFFEGQPSDFAQDHLEAPAAGVPGPVAGAGLPRVATVLALGGLVWWRRTRKGALLS